MIGFCANPSVPNASATEPTPPVTLARAGVFSTRVARRTPSGLTLLEMLVVFVLASLVGTLLIQGAGFFLGQYDNVRRIGREASSEALQQRWFATTVHAMVPFLAVDKGFAGEAGFFQGITMQPLRSTSGVPVAARWSIESGEEGAVVVYVEEPPACPSEAAAANSTANQPPDLARDSHAERDSHAGGVARSLDDTACANFEDTRWTVLESDEPLAFEYAGVDGVWRTHWPVDNLEEWIPRQVRLVTSARQIVWTASFGLFQEPVINPRDFR